MEKIKPTTEFNNVYIVQNYGTFRGMFYYLKDAKDFVKEEGMNGDKPIYQIYKGRLKFEVQLYY